MIIPVYNSAETLERALASILDKYGGRVTVLRQKNGGPSAARDVGIKHASCRYIAFLGSNGDWLPDFFQYFDDAMSNFATEVAGSVMTRASN